MKKLLLAALAVSAFAQPCDAASRRGVATRGVTTTPHTHAVTTKLGNLRRAFDELNRKHADMPKSMQKRITDERAIVQSYETMRPADYAYDSRVLNDTMREIEQKTNLYRTLTTVSNQINSQVESEVRNSEYSYKADDFTPKPTTDQLNRKKAHIKERAQNLLGFLLLGTSKEFTSMLEIANKIAKHGEGIEDVEAFEEGVLARLQAKKAFLKTTGFVTQHGGHEASKLSYNAIVSLLNSNLRELVALRKSLRAINSDNYSRSQSVIELAKTIVAHARQAYEAQLTINSYTDAKERILRLPTNRYSSEYIKGRLADLELRTARAHRTLISYDMTAKRKALEEFNTEVFTKAVQQEKTSWLKPYFAGFAALVAAYLGLRYTEKGKALTAKAQSYLPQNEIP